MQSCDIYSHFRFVAMYIQIVFALELLSAVVASLRHMSAKNMPLENGFRHKSKLEICIIKLVIIVINFFCLARGTAVDFIFILAKSFKLQPVTYFRVYSIGERGNGIRQKNRNGNGTEKLIAQPREKPGIKS